MPNRLPPHSMEISRKLAAAEQYLEKRGYEAAHGLCLEVLKAAPETGEAFLLLAVIAADHSNHAKAVELLDRAIGLVERPAKALALKARSLIALNRRAEAVGAAEAAAALTSGEAFTLDTLGVVFSRAGLHERAPDFYARAAAAGGTAGQHYNLGASLQFLGKFAEAEGAYRACIAREPHHAKAWSSLMQIVKATRESGDVAAMESAFAARESDPDDALSLGHALAKAHEDLGDPAAAMEWLAKAKAGKRAAQPYDVGFDAALFAAAERSASLPAAKGFEGAAPIFIVGMPRTGTTLVDRILSSHSAVTSAGELTDLALAVKRVSETRGAHVLDAETMDAAAGLDAAALGSMYVRSVQATLGIEGRFTDKMPLNVFLSAHILRALPKARVICLRRHPADTVLSNYRQLFATSFSYYAYAGGLTTTAEYYVRFDALVKQFAEALPGDRFREVHYEELVTNFEAQVRGLLGFCGLEFEQACLDFHENAAPVATASAAQVRQPLYRSALGRWKRYRPGLDPAIEVLERAGVMRE